MQVFEKTHRVNRYNCCVNCAVGLASAGLTCVFCPVGVLCPGKLFPYYSLKARAARGRGPVCSRNMHERAWRVCRAPCTLCKPCGS
jgi:hypothetical protein